MASEQLWKALETGLPSADAQNGGWLLRLARPAAGCPVFVGLELATRRRAVLLRLPANVVPSRNLWPRSKGLEGLTIEADGKSHFGVTLKESRFVDVFAALVDNLLSRLNDSARAEQQIKAFLGQLERWQRFLSISLDGLSDKAQRGLWGELHFLREHLIPALGASAVRGWKGGEKAHQDFQFRRGAIEIKTTLAKQPQVIRITSERQLDERSWPVLILNVTILEIRSRAGESLPALVSSVRAKLAEDGAAREQFEDGLLAWGYLDAHEPRYCDTGYILREEKALMVRDGFPRLIEKDLPPGIGCVEYGLGVAACDRFRLTSSKLSRLLRGWANSGNTIRKKK